MMEKGFLPNGNVGWINQTNKFLQMMTFIENNILEEKQKNARK